ncbi:MAG: hypothetical protein KGL23_09865 [Acidobacteriota bacterium]|nr:hypothetical protein [Acidobacteriota bacterium]MDE3093804.1 hypothetical protein [Acidobacteriota bacterium]MDE3139942.1 hypothetical protein [Acidobacteriota bacterium]MDE3147722.1 hypothetical protein [Acidobacteriota bacterium]
MIEVAMSAYDDLVTAARSLRDQGTSMYSLADLVAAARRYGSTYPESTLRAAVAAMVATSADDAEERDALVEVRKGWYRLRR